MSNLDSDQRLIALEEKLSYQQRQLEELNQVIVEQQREINLLRREVNALSNTVKGLMENGGENLPHEKPPHY
jgi:SlyX protein